MTSGRLHFLSLSQDPVATQRCQSLCAEFEYSFENIDQPEIVLDLDGKYDMVHFVLINASTYNKKEEIVGTVQMVRQIFKESFICVIVNKRIPAEVADFVRKSGANIVFLENEFLETSRLEFVASQVIRASFVPVKLSEFSKDSVLDFTLFHLMPLNQKLLPVLPKGSPLTEGRLKKLDGIGEVYVRRDEVDRYRAFVEANPDRSGQGLKSRCRAQYLSFCNSHTQLIFNLIDQSENASFKEGKWLYDRCEMLAKDLLVTLSTVGEAWDVVNNSSIGEFGSVERSPAISAYAGLISLMTNLGEPTQVMIAGLLSDVGMLELPPALTKKMRQGHGTQELSSEEMELYRRHPVTSLNRCLARKLSLKEEIKEMILCSHERVDRKGFPEGREGPKILFEAMLLQFSELMDQGAMVKMGQARRPVQDVRRDLLKAEIANANIFSYVFLQKLKPLL